MTTYQNPITDRTAEDVTNKTVKAFFNVADWQRIYNNAQVTKSLVDFLLSINITFNSVATSTITTIPTAASLNTLLANINLIVTSKNNLPAIAGLTTLKDDWAEGTGADSPDYLDANEWETILDLILSMVINAVEYRIYCGVANVGQPRFWQHRFRDLLSWVANAVSPVRLARTGIAACGVGLMRNNRFRRYA